MRLRRCDGRVCVAFERVQFYWNDSVHMQRWNAWQRATVRHDPGALKLGRFVITWGDP